MGGKKWTDEQINDLLKQARGLYETDIPLAKEIVDLKYFIFQIGVFAAPKDSFKFKVTKVVFSFWHLQRTCAEEIEVPEQIAWKMYHEARGLLDIKCDQLKGMMGGKYIEDKTLFAK